MTTIARALAGLCCLLGTEVLAADLDYQGGGLPGPGWARSAPPPRLGVACLNARARPYVDPRIPLNTPADPTYVGSSYGLGHPSFDGTPPAAGTEAAYGIPPEPCR